MVRARRPCQNPHVTTSPNRQRALMIVLAALLIAIGVILLRNSGSVDVHRAAAGSEFAGPTMPPGLHAADFSLRDQSGHRVTLSHYRGQVVVLTFIHSLCHDTCPFMVEQIKGALNDLAARGQAVAAIGVSVDPSEDTIAHRRAFLGRHEMSQRLAFVNGSLPTMRRVWHAFAMQPVAGKVDHSTFVLLIDKRGIERIGFPADQLTPEGLAHDIRALERERA